MSNADRLITMSDVALRAGVSRPTVSYVLNGKREGVFVTEETRERIMHIAQEMGYRRNGYAKAVATGRFGSVALLLSTISSRSSMPPEMWNGLYDELAAHDLHLMTFKLPDEQLSNEHLMPKVLREWMTDGLLVDYTHGVPPQMEEAIKKHAMPAIWLNARRETDAVFPDDWNAGVQTGRKLLEAGCRRIVYSAYVGGTRVPEEHYSVYDRRDGCAQVLQEAGLALDEFTLHSDLSFVECVAAWQKYLQEEHPDAVVTYSEVQAETLLRAAELMHLEVPRDLCVINFGPTTKWRWIHKVSCFEVPEYEIGKRAVQMLLKKIRKPKQALPSQTVPFRFQQGESSRV